MYSYADAPSLKLFGLATELMGTFSLLSAVYKFKANCLDQIEMEYYADDDNDDVDDGGKLQRTYPGLEKVKIKSGPGYICFMAGCIGAFCRFILQLLTPMPHRGKGFFRPLFTLFYRTITCGPGCCVLWKDEEEEEKRIRELKELAGLTDVERISHTAHTDEGQWQLSVEITATPHPAQV